jgi:Ca2+-binding RTX toxin-like protein
VVNHLKSKGSGCGAGDDDTTTGQGNCNGTRTLAAQALADWLAGDPTGSGDPDFLIIGDLNSYAKEDPIVALQTAGYTNLVASFGGPSAYSYVFDGQLGYLDHALSNPALTAQVAGVAEWHINADEVPLFDYNDDVRDAGEANFEEESDTLPLYAANPSRTSDHDPVIVGLGLNINTTCNGLPATIVGTTGDDVIDGTNGDDVIVGLGGNDVINGGNGDDIICGNAGDDTLNGGTGDDTLLGSYGLDTLNGQNGVDTLDGGDGDDILSGGNEPDTLTGGNGNDSLAGGTGDDVLDGGANNDALAGDKGDDSLTGGTGADSFSGGQGNDTTVDFNAGEGDTSDGT